MYKIMSNHCTYSEIHYEALEPTILVEENVVWEDSENDNVEEQETVHYTDNGDNTLSETANESFMTADGSDNTTQYFSVLDSTNQTILNDISDVTINNSIIREPNIDDDHHEEHNCIDINNGQVVLFKVDGSEDLYGFQLTHDEEGNLQKYQFKVRQNIEGNLEAIPETLQILPVDTDVNQELPNETEQENVEEFQSSDDFEEIDNQQAVFVKQEQNLISDEQSTPEFDEEEIFEEQLDTKEGILELTPTCTQKQEIQEISDAEHQEYIENIPSAGETSTHEEVFYSHGDTLIENNFYHDETEENVIEDNGVEHDENSTAAEHYEELFVKESHLVDDTNGIVEENGEEESEILNESDNEEYETVDGIHVTGDTEENIYEDSDIRKSPSYQRSTLASRKKIIKNVIRKVRIQKNDGKANLYYLVKNTEKENMGQAPSNSITIKPNPRSILKCSLGPTEPQKFEEEEKYDKRFAKSKEAQQARLFHNFIAQTKIIHAPVRQGRLPRKQQIKPMKRTDEEIVVQEVVVSSNGFIETSEEGVLKERVPLKPTEYIQLTDSDEDFDPKAPHKKKRRSKRRKPMLEITISDSEEESSDDSDETEDDENETSAPAKRPRGRPPKQHDKSEEKEVTKRPRGRPPKNPKPSSPLPDEEIIVIKIDNKCPQCPKSFPSEGSLRSHMQYHNFSQSKSNEPKYMCDKCGDIFKNSFLLNRHMSAHKTSNIICRICKKVFIDQAQLITHKRTHIKQQMFRTTTLPKDSPKAMRTPMKNKCDDCGKIFKNRSALNMHKKQHNRYSCQTCGIAFVSKFMLDNHFRLYCTKKRSPRTRLTLNVKKVLSPKILPKRLPTRQSAIPQLQTKEFVVPSTMSTNNTVVTNIKCDSCSMTFATYTSLFKHKVLKHGLDTPDKSIFKGPERKSLYKHRTGHSGVPPSTKLKNAYMSLRSKLEK